MSHTDTDHDCGGCTLHDALNAPAAIERREFLRFAGAALASIGFMSLRPSAAIAMPVTGGAPLAARPGDRSSEKRYAVPAADGVMIDKDNAVIIARAGGKVYAFSLSCPHQNTALRWDNDDHVFMCPKHKSHYRPDGTFIDGRATRDMDRLPIKRDAGQLVVDVDDVIQQDEKQKEWTAAFVAL
jgi:nitrite reductase/ring-hydroxylating ferredoxin subunit